VIKENLVAIEKRICAACERSGRDRKDVTLVAVSKTKPIEMVEEAVAVGIVDFGENKVQELTQKEEIASKPLRWHFIGHLQRNKVKYIVDKAYLIHSVDSLRLAEQINLEAEKKNVLCPILIEVNVAKEDTKFGVFPEEVLQLVKEISTFSHIKIKGLMTIAPFVENPEENRKHFRNLQKLSIDIAGENIDNVDMEILSMGMTGDFEVAIEEGATHIRVGTGIFGVR
jgi:hypothetical protein